MDNDYEWHRYNKKSVRKDKEKMTLGELIDKYGAKALDMHVSLGTEEKVRGDGMITIYEGTMADIPDYFRVRKVIDSFNNPDGTPWNIDLE